MYQIAVIKPSRSDCPDVDLGEDLIRHGYEVEIQDLARAERRATTALMRNAPACVDPSHSEKVAARDETSDYD